MSCLVGVVLALIVAVFAAVARFDCDRASYPTVLIAIASYYVLFAEMGDSLQTVATEAVIMAAFAAIAVVGFRTRLWIVAAGLAGHGVRDAVHDQVVANAGVPAWWHFFCLALDVTAAGAV